MPSLERLETRLTEVGLAGSVQRTQQKVREAPCHFLAGLGNRCTIAASADQHRPGVLVLGTIQANILFYCKCKMQQKKYSGLGDLDMVE